jgi:hypothetical protein
MGSFFKIGEALIRPEAAQTLPEYFKKPSEISGGCLEIVQNKNNVW